jgi:hypothetical protein
MKRGFEAEEALEDYDRAWLAVISGLYRRAERRPRMHRPRNPLDGVIRPFGLGADGLDIKTLALHHPEQLLVQRWR